MIQVPDAILKRQDQRQEDLQKKQDHQPSQAEVFRETFKDKQLEIEDLLNSIEKTTDKIELAEHFDQISKSINQLSRYLASSSIFLIPYDIKISKSAIQSLQEQSIELENKYLPRKKFTFKNRRDLKTANDRKNDIVRPHAVDQVDKSLINITNAYTVTGRSDCTVMIGHGDIKNKDVTLSKLVNCSVFIHGGPNTLHLITLESCRIVCGPVTTSVLVENCSDSYFAFPCQQLRVHNTRTTDFYIHVTTKAIIEDTSRVRFAPYGYFYDGLDSHYDDSGLDRDKNNWDDVDDFNWLVHNKQSPNWSIIPETERQLFLESLLSYLNNQNIYN